MHRYMVVECHVNDDYVFQSDEIYGVFDDNGKEHFKSLLESKSFTKFSNYTHMNDFVCCMYEMACENSGFTNLTDVNVIFINPEDDCFDYGLMISYDKQKDEFSYKMLDWRSEGQHFTYKNKFNE